MKTISIRFDHRTLAQIRGLAKKNGVSVSTQIKELARIGLLASGSNVITVTAHDATGISTERLEARIS